MSSIDRTYSHARVAVACIHAYQGGQYPVGTIHFMMTTEDSRGNREPVAAPGMLVCDGSFYACERFPALYNVIGDQFNPKVVYAHVLAPWWMRIFNWKRRIPVERPNPQYKPGYFRLPDLRQPNIASLDVAEHNNSLKSSK